LLAAHREAWLTEAVLKPLAQIAESDVQFQEIYLRWLLDLSGPEAEAVPPIDFAVAVEPAAVKTLLKENRSYAARVALANLVLGLQSPPESGQLVIQELLKTPVKRLDRRKTEDMAVARRIEELLNRLASSEVYQTLWFDLLLQTKVATGSIEMAQVFSGLSRIPANRSAEEWNAVMKKLEKHYFDFWKNLPTQVRVGLPGIDWNQLFMLALEALGPQTHWQISLQNWGAWTRGLQGFDLLGNVRAYVKKRVSEGLTSGFQIESYRSLFQWLTLVSREGHTGLRHVAIDVDGELEQIFPGQAAGAYSAKTSHQSKMKGLRDDLKHFLASMEPGLEQNDFFSPNAGVIVRWYESIVRAGSAELGSLLLLEALPAFRKQDFIGGRDVRRVLSVVLEHSNASPKVFDKLLANPRYKEILNERYAFFLRIEEVYGPHIVTNYRAFLQYAQDQKSTRGLKQALDNCERKLTKKEQKEAA